MVAVEIILLSALICLGVITSISDIREGVIKNRILVIFALIGLILDVVYYVAFVKDIAVLFIINVLAVVVLSLILYFTHSLAGGDCKLSIVLALLYPARMYLMFSKSSISLFLTLCFAVLLGYIWLLLSAVWRIIIGENKITANYAKSFILAYLKSYIRAMIYVILTNQVFALISLVIDVPPWVVFIMCIAMAWSSGRVKWFQNRYIIVCAFVADICLTVMFRTIPFSLNPRSYVFTAVLILCQMMIRTNIYETISTYKIRKGMILSSFSSMLLQSSNVKGLPGLSAEDLRNRLTSEEADSIHEWGKTEKGQSEIVIVRKIPFAVFIAAGYICYLIIWRIVA